MRSNIVTGGLEVFSPPDRLRTSGAFRARDGGQRIPELDALWWVGVSKLGTSTLLIGPAGAGRSPRPDKYAEVMARRGERAALFLFDETIATM